MKNFYSKNAHNGLFFPWPLPPKYGSGQPETNKKQNRIGGQSDLGNKIDMLII